MENETIISTIRTLRPTREQVENAKIIIKVLIRNIGIKEINIKDSDNEEVDFIF